MEELKFPKAQPERPMNRLKKGANLLKVKAIRIAKDDKGVVRKNKNDAQAMEVVFVNKEEHETSELFWLDEKSQWRLDDFLRKIGIDNKNGEVPVKNAINKLVWYVAMEEFQMENGKRKTATKDGKTYPVSYMRLKEFVSYKNGDKAPVYEEADLVSEKEAKGSGTSSGTPKAAVAFEAPPAEAFQPQEEAPSNDDWSQADDWGG